MPWKRKHQRPSSRPGTRCCLPILALYFLASSPILAQGSIEPKPRESQPASTRPERLYTEEEALAAAEAAAKRAVDVAVPLAVQAAVAEERGKTAAQQLLDRAALEALTRQARNWRAMALIAMGAGTGSLADGGRGALYGATGGAVATAVWWIAEFWPKRASALAPP